MIDRILVYIQYVIFHRWNKVSKESIEIMDKYWADNPNIAPKTKKLYLKVKKLNDAK